VRGLCTVPVIKSGAVADCQSWRIAQWGAQGPPPQILGTQSLRASMPKQSFCFLHWQWHLKWASRGFARFRADFRKLGNRTRPTHLIGRARHWQLTGNTGCWRICVQVGSCITCVDAEATARIMMWPGASACGLGISGGPRIIRSGGGPGLARGSSGLAQARVALCPPGTNVLYHTGTTHILSSVLMT